MVLGTVLQLVVLANWIATLTKMPNGNEILSVTIIWIPQSNLTSHRVGSVFNSFHHPSTLSKKITPFKERMNFKALNHS